MQDRFWISMLNWSTKYPELTGINYKWGKKKNPNAHSSGEVNCSIPKEDIWIVWHQENVCDFSPLSVMLSAHAGISGYGYLWRRRSTKNFLLFGLLMRCLKCTISFVVYQAVSGLTTDSHWRSALGKCPLRVKSVNLWGLEMITHQLYFELCFASCTIHNQ